MFKFTLIAPPSVILIGPCPTSEILFERIVVKPFRNSPLLMVLVATVALGIIIRESVRLFYPEGSNPHVFPKLFPQIGFHVGPLYFRAEHLIIFGISLLLIIALMMFINRTKIGLAIRAISQNIEAASLMGINPDITIMVTFFTGSLLAGIAGIQSAWMAPLSGGLNAYAPDRSCVAFPKPGRAGTKKHD